MAAFAEISSAQTKIFQEQVHKNGQKRLKVHLRCNTNSDQVC